MVLTIAGVGLPWRRGHTGRATSARRYAKVHVNTRGLPTPAGNARRPPLAPLAQVREGIVTVAVVPGPAERPLEVPAVFGAVLRAVVVVGLCRAHPPAERHVRRAVEPGPSRFW